ncbi:phosphatase PAP2 family protein [Flavobacterium sp. WC2421]|jgi:roadblock/LC7 domain-containing protein|uniref:Vanadium-dependent haloperoxidase n=1 Tax=Flavobacterium sp. WC2409 TaxID=3234139 RepID=A0AB39W9H8_9FLAO
MKKIYIILSIILVGATTFSQNKEFSSNDYVSALKKVTDVMVNDVTSPVAAARYYSYVTLGSNEATSIFYNSKNSFAPSINQFKKIEVPNELIAKSNASFATVFTVFKMAEKLLPSGYLLATEANSLKELAIKRGISKEQVEYTAKLVELVVNQMMEYVKADGFSKLSSYKKYTPTEGDGYWQPTGPGYMMAIEPNWFQIRPFYLVSCDQFKPAPPAPFDLTKTSSFYIQLNEVYKVVNKLSKKQRAIASFWDCNPFILNQIGHVEFGLKKISPGGHWMGITGIACLKKGTSLTQTAFIHCSVAITLSDAFISCWDEKYRSNRIRPETAINKWIDKRWKSVLQTPPFPEYTSGHSVISTAAATVLTQILGTNFSFTDTTELEFGLSQRKFKSFLQASQEAAISRLYGGIHYRDAIENGVLQGSQIGKYIGDKILKSDKMNVDFIK